MYSTKIPNNLLKKNRHIDKFAYNLYIYHTSVNIFNANLKLINILFHLPVELIPYYMVNCSLFVIYTPVKFDFLVLKSRTSLIKSYNYIL